MTDSTYDYLSEMPASTLQRYLESLADKALHFLNLLVYADTIDVHDDDDTYYLDLVDQTEAMKEFGCELNKRGL